ncbi:MAG TPA: hypothetical protein VHN79_01500 [Lacunisphaera sp.]|nr:hypothetical protein [Lacunisphaera sp.]
MSTRFPFSKPAAATAVAAFLLMSGCESPTTVSGGVEGKYLPAKGPATPNFGPPMQDTRTEAVIQQMELDYNAAKNSRPTQQHVAAAEEKRKEQEQAEATTPPPESPK